MLVRNSMNVKYAESIFSGKASLQKHRSTLVKIKPFRIQGEKPYKCEICCKSVACHTGCKNYVKLHTRKMLFMCNRCNKTFPVKRKLLLHLRTHTG